jgi:hypothetical protein
MSNEQTVSLMQDVLFTTGSFQVLEAKRAGKNKYSVLMRSIYNKREYGFTYTDVDNTFDMRFKGDVELLCILAADWYNDKYLTC